MTGRARHAAAAVGLLAVLGAISPSAGQLPRAARPPRDERPVVQRVNPRYQVVAGAPRLMHRVTGPVTSAIRGVPAEPVDSMCYDGSCHHEIAGQAILEVDIVHQRGMLRVWWEDSAGRWELRQKVFHHPHHTSGVRMGSAVDEVDELINLAITQNVYLNGDTGAGTPVQPTVFTYLATWGLYEVTLDGERFPNPFGWPGPELWHGHAFVTEGVHDDHGAIRNVDGAIYDPARDGSRGRTYPDDLELHLAFHDERFPLTANVPALYAFEYHMVFEEVELRVTDSQSPLTFDGFAEREPSAAR